MFLRKFLYLNLCLLYLILSLPGSIIHLGSLQVFMDIPKICTHLPCPSPGWTVSSFSAFPSFLCLTFFWALFSVYICGAESWALVLGEGEGTQLSSCWPFSVHCSPEYHLLALLHDYTVGSWSARIPGPLLQCCVPDDWPPVSAGSWGYSCLGARLRTSTLWGSCCPISSGCMGSLNIRHS